MVGFRGTLEQTGSAAALRIRGRRMQTTDGTGTIPFKSGSGSVIRATRASKRAKRAMLLCRLSDVGVSWVYCCKQLTQPLMRGLMWGPGTLQPSDKSSA